MECTLCPRLCRAVRPVSGKGGGVCGTPQNAVVSRAGLHFWEEPVISGTQGSGTVFFAGCNLHCVYCQNYEISSQCAGKEISVARLQEIYAELIARGAHNINLVTPTHFTGAILQSLETPLPVPVVYNTNGYDLPETIRLYRNKAAIYLPDLKYADDAVACRYSGVKDYFARTVSAIKEMYSQTGKFQINDSGIMERGVIIRHLMLPGQLENTLKVIRFVAENFRPGEVMFSLMRQYTPCGLVSAERFPELNRTVSDEEYTAAENALFDSGIEDGFVQDAESAGREFIPAFDGTGV